MGILEEHLLISVYQKNIQQTINMQNFKGLFCLIMACNIGILLSAPAPAPGPAPAPAPTFAEIGLLLEGLIGLEVLGALGLAGAEGALLAAPAAIPAIGK